MNAVSFTFFTDVGGVYQVLESIKIICGKSSLLLLSLDSQLILQYKDQPISFES
jgi:hypothetical protein